ncbi:MULTISPECIES: TonB family protein [Rhodanobacter]|uniref:TonB family protein n=1 Tax=Rhodanobacter TaxID=75309 RepID=UPI00041759F7|nr:MULTISPECIES: TonB family protein [Rhodanobacter]UJJ49642.1 TonB family protein [Rhodanobacter denitrificans]UJJ58163.1 TonB family protein [Rhodanobacter denitrificans]UJM92356.1 TonB family protein [Rhodanobacter denitrificans]UJM95885.1 TonB family protein [Rhodanobacter denitrificans]UJN21284.1 TonB family protein [Rhodanobacter denitrificans]
MKAKGLILGCMLLWTIGAAHASDLVAGEAAIRRGDYAVALVELRPLATQGVAAAQADIGSMYQQGLGVTKDVTQARQWYFKAATQGFGPAQSRLGHLYMDGKGGDQDYAKAFEWLGKAAEQGDVAAQSNLGMLYLRGLGTAQDFAKAAGWFFASATGGNAYAQTDLGLMYASGRGVPRDVAVGYALLVLSAPTLDASSGVAGGSARNRKVVAGLMTPAQLEASKLLASQMRVEGILPTLTKRGIALPQIMLDPTRPRAPPPPSAGILPAGIDLTYQRAHPAQYPKEAVAARHQGRVVVLAVLTSNGEVEDAKVESSSGYPELDASALAAVSNWKYAPCTRYRQPVACYVREPVNFALTAGLAGLAVSTSGQQSDVPSGGESKCRPEMTVKECELTRMAGLLKRMDQASATIGRSPGVAGNSLMDSYALAIQTAVTKNWLLPDGLPKATCRVNVVQLPGGKVESATADTSCPYDDQGRRSVVNAVLRTENLPYKGFESVFRRNIVLTFFPPEPVSTEQTRTEKSGAIGGN